MTAQTQGTGTQINIGYQGSGGANGNVAFNETGAVLFDASGNMGTIDIYGVTNSIPSATSLTFNANAKANKDQAGTISWSATTSTAFPSAGKTLFEVNGPSSGSGNAGTINFYPGTYNLNIGTNNGDVAFSGTGGAKGGNGITSLFINPTSGNINFDTAGAVTVQALSETVRVAR